jgi:hypothetical protein
MQKDFHFSVIYGLCRCWGFGPGESQVVASASQFTDDCVVFRKLLRPDGGEYKPIETQCQPQRALGPKGQREILRPFHFLQEGGRDQAVVAGNALAATLVEDALNEWGKGKRHGPHAFGIALHVYADTFAHQGFSPFRSEVNAVKDLSLASGDERRRKKIIGSFFAQYPSIPPRIGHAEAFSCPDLPFLTWYYTPPVVPEWIGDPADGVSLVEGQIRRENPLIAAAAAAKATDLVLQSAPRKANRDEKAILKFFSKEAFMEFTGLEGREQEWRKKILGARTAGGCFDFLAAEDEEAFEYLGDVWPTEAYRLHGAGGRHRYGLVKGYTKTDWWKFQQAAGWYLERLELPL